MPTLATFDRMCSCGDIVATSSVCGKTALCGANIYTGGAVLAASICGSTAICGADVYATTGVYATQVGVGAPVPTAKLHIAGAADVVQLKVVANATQTSHLMDIFASDGTTAIFHVLGNGNVGIGTITPTGKLHFKASSVAYGAGGIRFEQSVASVYWDIMPAYDQLYFGNNGSTIMVLGSTGFYNGSDYWTSNLRLSTTTVNDNWFMGKVGIGTRTPTYALDVRGTATTSGVNSQAGYNINILAAPVAIGGYTLDVGTNLGVGTYYYMVAYVTALGETGTGAVLTVTTTTGNTKVLLTGIPVSTDPRVTARKIYRTKLGGTSDNPWYLATIAGNVTDTYTDNTADTSLTGVGLQAYKVNTTSDYISTGGTQAMILDPNLTAIGTKAGLNIISSNAASVRCVLVGANAGTAITTGSGNVIVGVAGVNLTTGSSNTYIGDLAGYFAIGVFGDTALGVGTLRTHTTGNNNVAVGREAGSTLNDGATTLTSCSESLYLGYRARAFANGETNAVVIGGSIALGLGSNTTVIGTAATTITALFGNLGLGITAPTAKLHIVGSADVVQLKVVANATQTSHLMDIFASDGTTALFNVGYDGSVGIGTATPSSAFEIVSQATYGSEIRLTGYDSSGLTNALAFRASRGTLATPVTVNNGDRIAAIFGAGHDGTAFRTTAAITMEVDGTVAPTSVPTSIKFYTNAVGAVTRTERMKIDNAGNVGIGTIILLGTGATSDTYGRFITSIDAATTSSNFQLIRKRVAGALSSEDQIGKLLFVGYADATTERNTAAIEAYAEENYSLTASGSYLTFKTTAPTTNGRTERMRISGSGNVGIGGTPNANAALDVQSTTKAFMPPRMTTTERDAIATPTEGMYIHNTTTHVLNFYNGSVWAAV